MNEIQTQIRLFERQCIENGIKESVQTIRDFLLNYVPIELTGRRTPNARKYESDADCLTAVYAYRQNLLLLKVLPKVCEKHSVPEQYDFEDLVQAFRLLKNPLQNRLVQVCTSRRFTPATAARLKDELGSVFPKIVPILTK